MISNRDVFAQIKELLIKKRISFQVKEHLPTPTSEDSARERNEPLRIGAKALVIKADERFIMVIVPGDRKIDSQKLKRTLNAKKLRFATVEELEKLTGLKPGAVPPWGNLFNLPTLMEKSFLEEEYLAFNAGSLTTSIKMKVKDYIEAVKPILQGFSLKK